jgi:hypothetical protein
MKDEDRQWMFPQMMDYITGQSKLLPQYPRWGMKDIDDFWSMNWDKPNAPRSD